MAAMLGSSRAPSVVASGARCAARSATVQAAMPRYVAFKPSQVARMAFQSPRLRRRERDVVVWASWGADVQFSGATLAGTAGEAEGLHRLQLDIGALAAGYTSPGQYLQAKLSEDAKAGFFAIASPPDANNGGVVELLIKSQPGSTAEALCAAAPGAGVLVSSVMGKGFPVERIPPSSFHTVLIFATGSGISPIKALIESGALAAGERREVRLYYGAHSPAHMAFAASIPSWEADFGVKVVPVLSGEGQGYVQDVFQREAAAISDWSGVAAVLCGQKEMAMALNEVFAEKGVAKESVLTNF